jgi:hypothetical protein
MPAYLKPPRGDSCQSFLNRVGTKLRNFNWDERPKNCLPVGLSGPRLSAEIGFRQEEFNRFRHNGTIFLVPVEELFSAFPELALLLNDARESALRESGELERKAQGRCIADALEPLTRP